MSVPILEMTGLVKTYETGATLFRDGRVARVVDHVSLTIGRGETFGLVGESGSGKSTIGRLALRLIEADQGEIRFDGIDVRQQTPEGMKRLRRRMQIIFQDPFSSLDPRVRVGEAIAQPIRLHGLRPPVEVSGRVAELLDLVGLAPHQAGRYPHEFSGGQRQRIAIARALAVEPDFIVCDEPVSALDVSIQAQVLNLLGDLRDRLGMSLLFISHDMAVVRHLATHVGVLYAGTLVETGPAADVFGNPRHPYTRMLLAATPNPVPGLRARGAEIDGEPPSPYHRASGCPFASRCTERIDACLEARPGLDEWTQGKHSAACFRSGELPHLVPLSDDEAQMAEPYRRRLGLLRAARAQART